MYKTKRDFYKLLFKSIAVFCAFVIAVGLLTQGLYAASPVAFNSSLSEMKNVPSRYLYLTAQSFEDGSVTTSILDIRTGDKILEGDYSYAGSYGYGSNVQYVFEGTSRGDPQAVYEVSAAGVSKLHLTPTQLKNIGTAFAFQDEYGLFMYNTYLDKEINYEIFLYNRQTQEFTQVDTSAIDSKYLTGKDEYDSPLYHASFYADTAEGHPEYAVIEFNSDFDFRTGSSPSAKYSFVPETGELKLLEVKADDGSEGPLPEQVFAVNESSASAGEVIGGILTAQISLLSQAFMMVTPLPNEYYFIEEHTIYYEKELNLPTGPYIYMTQPVYGKQKLMYGENFGTGQERELASWFSTRYHYYTKLISIPESEDYMVVQISNKIGLLELSTGKLALITDFDEVVELDEYNDFTTGKVMVEVF